jgi:hypothetical protein
VSKLKRGNDYVDAPSGIPFDPDARIVMGKARRSRNPARLAKELHIDLLYLGNRLLDSSEDGLVIDPPLSADECAFLAQLVESVEGRT